MSGANTTENVVETTMASATNGEPLPAPAETTTKKADTSKIARLTKEIKGQLNEMDRKVRQTSETARQIGLKLKEVKSLVKAEKNSWEQFVKDELLIEKRQAQKYMRLADRWNDLMAKGEPAKLTIEQCLALLVMPNGPIEGLGKLTRKEGATEKPKSAAVEKPTDPGFCVSSTSELKDKKLQASDLRDSEEFLAADSGMKKFMDDTLAMLTRQIRQNAQKLSKGKEGPWSDMAVLALAITNEIALELKTLPVVKVVGATTERTPVTDATTARPPVADAAKTDNNHHLLNGAVAA